MSFHALIEDIVFVPHVKFYLVPDRFTTLCIKKHESVFVHPIVKQFEFSLYLVMESVEWNFQFCE